jgi:Spy/CpxP family protein refolding chaperone
MRGANLCDELQAAAEASKMYEPQHATLLTMAKREIEALRRTVEEQRTKLAEAARVAMEARFILRNAHESPEEVFTGMK